MANQNKRSTFAKALTFINLSKIPGPRWMKYLNYVRLFQNNILAGFLLVRKEYGDIASFPWPMNSIIIYSPEFAKSVLLVNNQSFIKGEQIEELRAVVGNGLATNNDHSSWLKSRSLLAREFNTKSVTGYSQVFSRLADEHFSDWKGSEFELDICEEMKLLTFKIACKTLLGKNLSEDDAAKVNAAVHFTSNITYQRIFKFFPLPYWLPTPTNFKFNSHYRNLDLLVKKLINEERLNPSTGERSVLQKLVNARDDDTKFSFSNSELRDEILTMLLAGHETSAMTLTWLLGLLAKYPAVQKQLYQEIERSKELMPSEYFENIKYLKCVIYEAMRLFPAFPVLSRKASSDVELGSFKIPKNTNVVIPIFVMQKDEVFWENPQAFLPERFYDESLEKSFFFMPFAKGPRRCIAEFFANTEIAIIVVNLLKNFKITLGSEGFPQEVAAVSLKPLNGMKLLISRRH